jgi:hypothetical protein
MKVVSLVLSIVMLTVCAVTYGQSPSKAAAISDAQKNFYLIETLVGTWQGSVKSDNPAWSTNKPMTLSISGASHRKWKRASSRINYRHSRSPCSINWLVFKNAPSMSPMAMMCSSRSCVVREGIAGLNSASEDSSAQLR